MVMALALASTISGESGITWIVRLSFSQAEVYACCRHKETHDYHEQHRVG